MMVITHKSPFPHNTELLISTPLKVTAQNFITVLRYEKTGLTMTTMLLKVW